MAKSRFHVNGERGEVRHLVAKYNRTSKRTYTIIKWLYTKEGKAAVQDGNLAGVLEYNEAAENNPWFKIGMIHMPKTINRGTNYD